MSVVAGDILRVVATLVWLDGNIMQNVFNAVVTGAGSPFDDDDVVDDCQDWVEDMYANLVTLMTDQVDGSQTQVYRYDSIDDDWDEVGSGGFSFNPSSTNDQLPRGVACLINARTLDPDVQGKKYLGGLTDVEALGGLWTATALTAVSLFAGDWVTAFVGATSGASFTPAVWSVAGTVAKALDGSITLPTVPAYQRRRKRGIGA